VAKRALTGLDVRIEMVYGERGARSAREGSNELGLGRHQGRADGRVVSSRERLGVASRFYGSA
jgi:hypothetical protein